MLFLLNTRQADGVLKIGFLLMETFQINHVGDVLFAGRTAGHRVDDVAGSVRFAEVAFLRQKLATLRLLSVVSVYSTPQFKRVEVLILTIISSRRTEMRQIS
uniref:Uncharacterized protein n=1 Tax=Romanomermis culicivorax TaxID=13658 RepID=A0A915HZF7_ROMCU